MKHSLLLLVDIASIVWHTQNLKLTNVQITVQEQFVEKHHSKSARIKFLVDKTLADWP